MMQAAKFPRSFVDASLTLGPRGELHEKIDLRPCRSGRCDLLCSGRRARPNAHAIVTVLDLVPEQREGRA
jgi:hypothetical protein